MKKPADNLMFASINMSILDKEQASKEILAIDEQYRFWDSYRGIAMIPLMTKKGEAGRMASDNRINAGEFSWVNIAPQIVVDWFEQVVFPWTGNKARIMALLTMPGAENNEHIDCDRSELNTQQHKFRIVLQGKTSTLYFITNKGYIRPPDIDGAFVMDGGWPHGMTNSTNEIKVTLAMGAPWNGNENYTDLIHHLNRQEYQMPDILEQYWKQR
jgi:hypothetical protein